MNSQVLIDLLREAAKWIDENSFHGSDACDLMDRIGEALATPSPIPDAAEGVEVPTVVAYLCNGGQTLMGAHLKKEAIWNAGHELMEVQQHNRIVSALRDGGGVDPWIACADRMPEDGAHVIVWRKWPGQDDFGYDFDYAEDMGSGEPEWVLCEDSCQSIENCAGGPGYVERPVTTHWRAIGEPLSKLETTTSQAGVGE